jgi:hypothetical protein
MDFPVRLCQAIERLGNKAYLIDDKKDVQWPRRFTSSGLKPDIYVLLDPKVWPPSFPGLVIETKSRGSRDITQVIAGVRKVIELRIQDPTYTLLSDPAGVAPRAGTVLLATPMGAKHGTVCMWEAEDRKWTKEGYDAATYTMQRLVWQFGGGLLLKGTWGPTHPPICDVNIL